MMAEIEEIPTESEDIPESAQDVAQDTQEKLNMSEDIPKNGWGRPAGGKNKAKPKTAPKPTPKLQKKKKPVEYDEKEEAPPPCRRVRPEQPVELDRHTLASKVLEILQQQRSQRTSARRSHYASWSENI